VRRVYRRGADTSSVGPGRVPERHRRGRLLARRPPCQRMQRTSPQRTVAALGTWGAVKASPLPHPRHSARWRSGRWSGRLAAQVATLAQGAGLAPVGQAAHMPQTLAAVRHAREHKTPDTLLGLQRHGVHASPWAPIAIREAHAAVAHLQAAMIGKRDAMDRASQVLEHLGWPSARALGGDHPRVGRELVKEVGKACGRVAAGRHLRTAPRLFGGGLLEGREARGAADRAQGSHRQEEARLGGHPTRAVLGQGPRGPQAVAVAVGRACRVPGMQAHGRAALAPQVLLAKLEERRADGAEQQRAQATCGGPEEGMEGVRHGKHGVAGGGRQSLGALRFDPLGRGPWLPLGTVAIAACAIRIARQAARRAPLRMPAELGRTPGQDGVDKLLLGRSDGMGLLGGVAIQAEDVGDCPRWPINAWLAVPSRETAHRGRHGGTPWRRWAALRPHPADRTG
jgi:hypothetical protein